MKYIISKDQYRRVLLKYLDSFIGNFDVEEIISKGQLRRDVRTSDGEDFGAVWYKGPATKGCKKELSIGWEYMDDLESIIPVKRKKVFSEVVLKSTLGNLRVLNPWLCIHHKPMIFFRIHHILHHPIT